MSLPAIQLPSVESHVGVEDYFQHPARLISESTYWRDYYEQSDTVYEWNNGLLEEKPVSDYETCIIYNWFMKLLLLFLQSQPIAAVTTLDMGFRLDLPNKVTVRKPDLGVVRNDNPIPLLVKDKSYHGTFDLCVEALSDSDKKQKERDTVTKKSEYAAAGVSEYFILHNTKERAFYRLNANGFYVPIRPTKDNLIQSMVLPGFQFRIEDLLNQPIEEEMIEDPVYRRFLLPAWQRDRAQRREAEQHAQTEVALRREAEQRAAQTETALHREAALRREAEQRAAQTEQRAAQIETALHREAVLRREAEQYAKAEIARLKSLLGE
ncbi:Uma2 family endonuclease [Gammaproteobacteria bacterium]